ncbi:o-succinylbenzoate--CoA ligase [Vibrio tapetis subsp. quintayensis]|uniref:o-succinylbenzoate--CoA ligase n=1 Tax=Vibrio tapetis TaxID=52443 RepID=UPI0025B310B7|nr:o-succinylbenzoate--CoA ligase [Vibrio tapetis]MDN3682260.1 o-succinylbenzoate--CoA ligase [Vibrio tapetis subsp. quintayensis]
MTGYLQHWSVFQPNKIAVKTQSSNLTWSELNIRVGNIASQLQTEGVNHNDVVAAVGKNCPDLLLLYLACLEIGAVMSPISPAPWAELEGKFKTLAPKYVWWQKQAERACKLPRFSWTESSLTRLSKAPCELPQHLSSKPQVSNQLVSLIFTSGSSGKPKAVAHTASQHIASAKGLLSEFQFEQTDSWLLSLPMYHVSGLAIVWRWLVVGAGLVIPGDKGLSYDLTQVTHASLVAVQLQRVLEDNHTLMLKRVLLGGSHIPESLCQSARERGVDTWLGYGMTEAASTVTAKRTDELANAGSVLPNRQLKLVGERIYIAGETLASGYYQNGIVTPLIRHDGWFDTKDLGQWQPNEQLKIIGRADNQFVSGGENIHCEEIEAVLNTHPQIQQSYIVPLVDTEFGHRPVAVLIASILLDKTNYDAFLAPKLTKFKWPIGYHLMPPELLGNGIKVSRQSIKQWLLEKTVT